MQKVIYPLALAFFISFVFSSSLNAASRNPDQADFTQNAFSPGPGAGLFSGKDLRVPLVWLHRAGDYGPGDYGRTFMHNGKRRYYEFHIPQGYSPGRPVPVVLILHGGGGYAAVMRNMTGMDDLSDREGFVAVYPAATNPKYSDRLLYWNDGRAYKDSRRGADDVSYIEKVLDDLSQYVNVDSKKIYATGMSNGAMMVFQLAAYLPHRIAAFAPVASQRAVGELAPRPSRAVPLIYFHGTEDRWAPFEGGRQSFPPHKPFTRISVRETIKSWVDHNQCPREAEYFKQGNAQREVYGPCKNGTEVIFWTLEEAGHTWPGGEVTRIEKIGRVGSLNKDISASEEMWKFFKRHSLPSK